MADVRAAVATLRPDIVGFTVRNIDTVLMPNNASFLDEIQVVVEQFHALWLRVKAEMDWDGRRCYHAPEPADGEVAGYRSDGSRVSSNARGH